MPRFRNPRFAPEFLERKLSPSSFTGVAVRTAEVASINNPPPLPTLPGTEPGDPPLPPQPGDAPNQP